MERIESLPKEAAHLYASQGRPFVTLSYAQSLDGSLTRRRGQPLAISGAQALQFTHRLRAAHDAILVGIGTILADDPHLTVRLVEGLQPQPVVLDSRLRIPPDAAIFDHPRAPWIAALDPIDDEKRVMLEAKGARIIYLTAGDHHGVSLPELLLFLGQAGIRSLMVEGGARVITAFLRESLVDQMILTVAPMLIGGLRAVQKPLNLPRLQDITYETCGDDLIVWGKMK